MEVIQIDVFDKHAFDLIDAQRDLEGDGERMLS